MPLLKALYITYDGINDPLGKSQVLPYLKRLGKEGIEVFLLSFEKNMDANAFKIKELKKELNTFNIHWASLKFHKGHFPVKVWDLAAAFLVSTEIVCKNKIKIVHSRGHFLAFIPVFLKRIFFMRFIFDMRGLWVEEKVDSGVLPEKGLIYITAKFIEKKIMLSADEIIVLTHALKDKLNQSPYFKDRSGRITVIPACVDTKLFYPYNSAEKPDRLFKDKFVVSYFGSVGTYYNFLAVIDFYKALSLKFKNAHLLIMLNMLPGYVREELERNGIPSERYHLDSVSYEEVPKWLRASDVSLIFYNRRHSREGCSPTKFAEYLACGLPVVINSGIGDTDKIIKEYKLGVVIDDFGEESYMSAVDELSRLMEERASLSDRCRRAAKDLFSLDMGISKYLDIYKRLVFN